MAKARRIKELRRQKKDKAFLKLVNSDELIFNVVTINTPRGKRRVA